MNPDETMPDHLDELEPLLFIDTETTGLAPGANALVTLSAIMLGGPHSSEHITITCRPHPGAIIAQQALDANRLTKEQIMGFPCPKEESARFVYWITERLRPRELARPVGWNFKFDNVFLLSWLALNNNPSWYGNTFTDGIDCLPLFRASYPNFKTDPLFGNAKLTTVYRGLFGRDLADAHTSLADAQATLDVFCHLVEKNQITALLPYLSCKRLS